MFWFWIAVGLLAAATTASLVVPLLRTRREDARQTDGDASRRTAVYRDRRGEIEAERDAGRLSAVEATRALDELVEDAAAQLLGVEDASGDASRNPSAGSKSGALAAPRRRGPLSTIVAPIAIAIVVPMTALLIYDRVGAPETVAMQPGTMRGEIGPHDAAGILAELSTRVTRNPNDAEAWALIGQTHWMTGDLPAAAAAYARATELLPADARLLADYAEVLTLTQNGDFAGKPMELLTRALAADPNEPKAIALMGAAQYRLGNRAQALVHMRKLAATLEPGSAQAREIAEVIARVESEIGAGSAQAKGPAAAAPPPVAAAPRAGAPFAGGAQTRPPAPAASAGAVVAGSIAVADELAKGIPPGAALFVVARVPDGPPVPLAAAKLQPSGWPLRFALSDAQAMDPSRLLSAAKSIVIEARVSMSGIATRRSGDLFGRSAVIAPGATDVAIRIDQRVP